MTSPINLSRHDISCGILPSGKDEVKIVIYAESTRRANEIKDYILHTHRMADKERTKKWLY